MADLSTEEEVNNQIQLTLEEDADLDDLVAGIMFDSSSDEEGKKQWGGSRPGRAPNKKRDFLSAYNKLMADFFNGIESVYDESDFERRFRMPRPMHEESEELVLGEGPFVQMKDATGKLGIHPKVKLVACLRYIAYVDAHDREDENLGNAGPTLHPTHRSIILSHSDREIGAEVSQPNSHKSREASHQCSDGWQGVFSVHCILGLQAFYVAELSTSLVRKS